MIMAFFLLLAGASAYAQTGIHLNYIHSGDRDRYDGSKISSPKLNGFDIGVDYEINILRDVLSFQPGLSYYHLMDEDSEMTGAYERTKVNYLQNYLAMPLHLKVKFGVQSVKMFVFVGPTITMGLLDRKKYSVDGLGSISYNKYNGKIKTTSTMLSADDFGVADPEEKDRFDVLFGTGVGIQLLDVIEFHLGLDYGLVNRYCDTWSADDYTDHRRQFYLGLAIRF